MRVLLVGDTHGNGAWLERAVFAVAEELSVDLMVQVGDFGWWPRVHTSDAFLAVARAAPVPLLWIDGNHEDHDELAAAVAAVEAADDGTVPLGGSLSFVPRGTRFDWAGASVVTCGGAHSIDRRLRVEGITWFDAEHVTDDDVGRVVAGGHADILLSHDAPAGWRIPGLTSDHAVPRLWEAELPTSHAHREQLARVMRAATPGLVVHGHYHSSYRRDLDMAWGPVDVVGLSDDGTAGNLALLTCEAGSWALDQLDATGGR